MSDCAQCIICQTLYKVRISMTRAYSAYSHASSVFTQCGHETSDPVSSSSTPSLTSNEASICLIFSSRHFLFIHKYFTHFPVYLYLCWHCTCTLISIITSVYLPPLPPSSPLHLFQKYFTLLQVYVVNSVYIQVYICICVWICVCVWICFIYPHHSLANWCYGLMAAHRDPTCCSIRNALHCSSFLLLMIILIDFTVAYVLHLDTHCTVHLLFTVSMIQWYSDSLYHALCNILNMHRSALGWGVAAYLIIRFLAQILGGGRLHLMEQSRAVHSWRWGVTM